MRRNILRKQAFTLVEIMIAVSIVILISALSIHSLLRAKITANETAAMKNLKALQSAFVSYRIVNPAYPGSLTALGSEMPPYIDSNLVQGSKQGYEFKLVDAQTNTFRLAALPIKSGVTGNKIFAIDESGVITEVGSNLASAGTLNTNEISAFSNMLTLHSAFQNYKRRYGIFPSGFGALSSYLDSALAQGVKDNYQFSVIGATGDSFQLAARPVSSTNNDRSFIIDQNGGITQEPPQSGGLSGSIDGNGEDTGRSLMNRAN